VSGTISHGDGRFPTTVGSAVRGAASADAGERERSWGALVGAYWKPAYKHLRVRWGLAADDASDAVQDFFARAMEKSFFDGFDPARARFRTFLRTCLDRHFANVRKAQQREKRGGPAGVALDFDEAERELARADASAWEAPEECFDREWRRGIFAHAVAALRAQLEATGKASAFRLFERYDLGEGPRPTYDDLGRELRMPPTTVTNQLALARRELRRLALEHLQALAANDEELRADTRHLFGSER
jgi:RNA polymerase sigma factor (sigma-70 family)